MTKPWPMYSISELGKVTTGSTPNTSDESLYGGIIPFVTPAELDNSNPVLRTPRSLSPLGVSKARLLPINTVMVCCIGSLGKVGIAGCPLTTNQQINSIEFDESRVLPRYGFYACKRLKSQLEQIAPATTVPIVNKTRFEELKIPLPSLSEQQRITVILDKADALRAKRRATLTLLDTLTQSIFMDMFGDIHSHQWTMSTVAEIAADNDSSIRTGPFGSQLLHNEFTENGIAVLGIDNAVENEFRWVKRRYISEAKYRQLVRYTVKPEDVLITIMGTCGRCAIVPQDIPPTINTKHLCCITLDQTKCLPVFLHAHFLQHPISHRYLEQKAKGAIMEGLNMKIIKEMPIPLVPIGLQKIFASKIKKLTHVKEIIKRSEIDFDSLFSSLQYRAFKGEL